MLKSLRTKRHQALREILIEARDKTGLSQKQIAKRLNKHQSFVSKTEIGERRLDVIEFITLTEALDADPNEILQELRKVDP